MYADELDTNIQIHLHENAAEIAETEKRVGSRGIAYLHDIGLLNPRLQAVHVTQIEPAEIDLLAETNVHVVHCPVSNAKLASGTCPTPALQRAGVNVCLGTDGAASNNVLDVFAEARFAALLAKLSSADASALPAATAMAMATVDGRRTVCSHGGEPGAAPGTLTPGASADLIAVDVSGPAAQPLHDPFAALLHGPGAAQVTHSWVAGRCLLDDGHCTTLDEIEVLSAAQSWREEIGR